MHSFISANTIDNTQLHSYTVTQLHSYTVTQLHSYTVIQLYVHYVYHVNLLYVYQVLLGSYFVYTSLLLIPVFHVYHYPFTQSSCPDNEPSLSPWLLSPALHSLIFYTSINIFTVCYMYIYIFNVSCCTIYISVFYTLKPL